ncbi:hypothetical protein GQ457_17G008230 [Hibiscus cannabinus]
MPSDNDLEDTKESHVANVRNPTPFSNSSSVNKTNRLLKFIDNTVTWPPQYIKEDGVVSFNPDYELYEEQDGALAAWLLSTIGKDVLPHLIGHNAASEIWNTLHRLYSGKTTSRLMMYRRLLHSQRKGELSMQQEHVTAILNGLPREYESVITVITANPNPSDLRTFRTILLDAESRQVSMVEQFPVSAHVVVQQQTTSSLVYTSSPNSQQGSSDQTTDTKNVAYSSDSNSGAYRGRGQGRFDISFKNESSRAPQHGDNMSSQAQAHFMSFGYESPSNMVYYSAPVPSNMVTQVQLPTHFVHTGAHHVAHQFQPSPSFPAQSPSYYALVGLWVASGVPGGNHVSQFVPSTAAASPAMTSQATVSQALIATPEVVDDNAWYPDSGATHHLTKDLNNLQIGSTYPGIGTVRVGYDNTIPIQSVGQSTLITSTRNLHLRNLLYVPNITKNLLSVSKFTQDNQVLEFYPKCCKVKDLLTKKVLLEGSESGGCVKHITNITIPSYSSPQFTPPSPSLHPCTSSPPCITIVPSNAPPSPSNTAIPLQPPPSQLSSPSPCFTTIPSDPPPPQLPSPSPCNIDIPSNPSSSQLSSPSSCFSTIPSNSLPSQLSSPSPCITTIPSDPPPPQLPSPSPCNTTIPSDPPPPQLPSPSPHITDIPSSTGSQLPTMRDILGVISVEGVKASSFGQTNEQESE